MSAGTPSRGPRASPLCQRCLAGLGLLQRILLIDQAHGVDRVVMLGDLRKAGLRDIDRRKLLPAIAPEELRRTQPIQLLHNSLLCGGSLGRNQCYSHQRPSFALSPPWERVPRNAAGEGPAEQSPPLPSIASRWPPSPTKGGRQNHHRAPLPRRRPLQPELFQKHRMLIAGLDKSCTITRDQFAAALRIDR